MNNQPENQARLKASDDVVMSYKVTHAKHKSALCTGSDTLCNFMIILLKCFSSSNSNHVMNMPKPLAKAAKVA